MSLFFFQTGDVVEARCGQRFALWNDHVWRPWVSGQIITPRGPKWDGLKARGARALDMAPYQDSGALECWYTTNGALLQVVSVIRDGITTPLAYHIEEGPEWTRSWWQAETTAAPFAWWTI